MSDAVSLLSEVVSLLSEVVALLSGVGFTGVRNLWFYCCQKCFSLVSEVVSRVSEVVSRGVTSGFPWCYKWFSLVSKVVSLVPEVFFTGVRTGLPLYQKWDVSSQRPGDATTIHMQFVQKYSSFFNSVYGTINLSPYSSISFVELS